ncbi:MAG: VWA domain-containing protein [Kofleriaceae bacterium]
MILAFAQAAAPKVARVVQAVEADTTRMFHWTFAHTLGAIMIGAVIAAIIAIDVASAPKERRTATLVARLLPWALVGVLGAVLAVGLRDYVKRQVAGEMLEWAAPNAAWLVCGAVLVGLIAFHLQRRRVAAIGFSQVGLVRGRGLAAWLSDLPGVMRVVAVAALAIALMRPETYKVVTKEEDSIDIMIVFDMSKSMEETDMPRDRMDAAQRVVRRFLRRTKSDRVGLVIFGQQAMLQCPLTQDAKLVEGIVRDLVIGDVPALGTAIGDGLALALAQLRRSDGTCDASPGALPTCPKETTCSKEGYCTRPKDKQNKVVILLSDGDSNWTTRFEPEEAARTAAEMGVKVYTVLVGHEGGDFLGFGGSVNPRTMRDIARVTGGEFFRATDYESFDRGFQAVRNKLDKTKRVSEEKIPGKQLFVPFAILAAILLALDLLLSHTWLRRLP